MASSSTRSGHRFGGAAWPGVPIDCGVPTAIECRRSTSAIHRAEVVSDVNGERDAGSSWLVNGMADG